MQQAGKSSAADGVAKQLTQMSPGPGGMIGARLGFRPLNGMLTDLQPKGAGQQGRRDVVSITNHQQGTNAACA